ncbi:MAG: SCO family protein, partial [Bacteroidia bacterium]|nr:SCO family protein [Bacteroidia bacterium]
MKKLQLPILIGLGVILIALLYLQKKQNKEPIRKLPYYGPAELPDKTKHTIPSFTFINQYNEPVTNKDVFGKIYVADYFFVTCKSICPIMAKQMQRVYKEFKDDKEVLILSHTVNPEDDSVSVLKRYAEEHGVFDKKWLFLTGDKKHLYELARKGYLLNAEEGDGGPDDFIHTQNFALIDKHGHIRGYYDGTDSVDVSRLIIDIKV